MTEECVEFLLSFGLSLRKPIDEREDDDARSLYEDSELTMPSPS